MISIQKKKILILIFASCSPNMNLFIVEYEVV